MHPTVRYYSHWLYPLGAALISAFVMWIGVNSSPDLTDTRLGQCSLILAGGSALIASLALYIKMASADQDDRGGMLDLGLAALVAFIAVLPFLQPLMVEIIRLMAHP